MSLHGALSCKEALFRRLRSKMGTITFKAPSGKGTADMVELYGCPTNREQREVEGKWCDGIDGGGTAHVCLIRVKTGPKPSALEVNQMRDLLRQGTPFPVAVAVVWAKPHLHAFIGTGPVLGRCVCCDDGWEFVWLV